MEDSGEAVAPDVSYQHYHLESRESAREQAEHFEAKAREQRRIEAAANAALQVLETALAEELDRQKQKPKDLAEKIDQAHDVIR